MYIDSHAHVEGEAFDLDREATIARAREAGVEMILSVGQVEERWDSMEASLALARAYPFVVTSVGLHPHDAKHFDAAVGARMLETSRDPKVVAWGECGLDFYYDNSPRERQKTAFREQLRLAREADLPVIVHSRDAADETLEILSDELSGSRRGGILHCFGYDFGVAHEALKLGLMISFSGIVTFKTAVAIKEAAADLPLDSILVETDCPFLAPVPYRGRRNEPMHVVEVVAEIARLRGVSPEEVATATSANFRRLFADRLAGIGI